MRKTTKGNAENETVIVINDGDRKDGYFIFGTSKRSHQKRLLHYVPKNELITKLSKDMEGHITWYSNKVPAKHLSESTLGFATLRQSHSGKKILKSHRKGKARQ